MKKKNLFILSIISFLCWYAYQNRTVEIHIPNSKGSELVLKMPLKDRNRLEYLFYEMVVWDAGGYTLFGVKPTHMNGYMKPFCTTKWHRFLYSIRPTNIRVYLGWKTWKKYEHCFADSKFLLYEEKNPFWKEPNDSIAIFLINKQKFHETVFKYLQDFKIILNRDNLNSEELLTEATKKSLFKDIFKNHEGLIGTVFGFGRNNAWLFEEKEKGKTVPLKAIWGEESEEHQFMMNRPDFAWYYFGICSEKIEDCISYPSFMVDPNTEETQNLKKLFHETRNKIIAYYKGKDFLEATLAILIEGSPG